MLIGSVRWICKSMVMTQGHSSHIQCVRVWICEFFGYNHVVNKIVANLVFSGLVFESVDLLDMTMIHFCHSHCSLGQCLNLEIFLSWFALLLFSESVFVSLESFTHDRVLLQTCSIGQHLNLRIFWSWQWFTSLFFGGSLSVSVNLSDMTVVCSFFVHWVSFWIGKPFGHDWDSPIFQSVGQSLKLWIFQQWIRNIFRDDRNSLLSFSWVSVWISEYFGSESLNISVMMEIHSSVVQLGLCLNLWIFQ